MFHWQSISKLAIGLVLATSLGFVAVAQADVFLLENGGRIEGEWLNRDQQPPTEYLIRTTAGVKLSLPITQVRQAVRQSSAAAEYLEKAPLTPESVPDQWALAQWCKERSLSDERKLHLRRVVELDPNHQLARRALGYQFLEGKWVTREQFRRQEGFELYKGKWRTPQEIEILEARARVEQAEKDWLIKLRRYRENLSDPKGMKLAYESLASIKDPLAVRPLSEMFVRERVRRVKMLYADVLANINTAESVSVLIERTLGDPDEEIFYYCLERLIEMNPPHLADPFVTALKAEYNGRINRSGMALGQIGDRSAISPLIDALITKHTHVLPSRPGTGPNSTTTAFGSGGTVMKQNEGPKVLLVTVQNQHVLDALTKLTGVNFGFDQRGWRFWHAQERAALEARSEAPTRRE